MKKLILIAFILGLSNTAFAADRPVVLELYTSQGCDSCPPAEAFLTKLADDKTLLPLSFHVDYWDYIGWKDTFSLKASTERQYHYATLAGKTAVFTPQLVIDGQKSVIGSRKDEVKTAIEAARKDEVNVPVTITTDKALGKLIAHIAVPDPSLHVPFATVTAVRFKHSATTIVKAGENKGSTLTSVNNVTDIKQIGALADKPQDISLPANADAETGVAVLLQQPSGRILGAATYMGM